MLGADRMGVCWGRTGWGYVGGGQDGGMLGADRMGVCCCRPVMSRQLTCVPQ